MKRDTSSQAFTTFILLILFISFVTSCNKILQNRTDDLMVFNRQVVQISSPGEDNQKYKLHPGEALSAELSLPDRPYPVKRSLRIVGASDLPKPYHRRSEANFRNFCYHIDDCLDSADTFNESFSLYFEGRGEPWERNAFYRISGSQLCAGKEAYVILPVKATGLKYDKQQGIVLEIQMYFKKAGRHADDIYDAADQTIILTVPQGNHSWNTINESFVVPGNIACLLLRLGGSGFSGSCRFGTPQLLQEGKVNPVPSFSPNLPGKENWIGENLSTKEWPAFEFSLNGKVFFNGRVFDRASEIGDFEVPFPDVRNGKYKLTMKLLDNFPAAYPYTIHRLELLESSARDFEVVSVPDFAIEKKDFSVLIETNKPDVEIQCSGNGGVHPLHGKLHISESGLHVIKFHADTAGVSPSIIISEGKHNAKVQLKQVLRKHDDSILLSTSDDIYIDKTREQFSNYIKWYLREGIGNAFCWRPSHQWSGVRGTDRTFYNWSLSLLKEMHMPYALMVEGRSIPGKDINPPDELMAGPYYLGRQAHEDDGSFYYWHHFAWQGLYSDLAAKFRPFGGIFAKTRPILLKDQNFVFYSPYASLNMEDGAGNFVRNIGRAKGSSTRHTGPSTLFHYFFQAGYDWLGAEQMYGPEEVILSSLRGASKAYHKDRFGTHLATQWSSGPFDAPEHATRLFLSLAISYMHGATHINTEDGLWNTEDGHDRYSQSGKEHIRQQKKIFDFIQTHERKGTLVSPIAILQGRNDAWKCFGRDHAWGQEGDEWQFGPAEKSFDLLNVYYPGSTLNSVYRSPCSKEQQGWYSGTPFGPVDLLPLEAPQAVLNSYRAIAFLGWNNFNNEDFKRLLNYVKQGGTLLLGKPHLNTELRHNHPVKMPVSNVLNELLGQGYKTLKQPVKNVVNNGSVIYFPQDAYPADPSIRQQYTGELSSIGELVVQHEREKGWIRGSEEIQFTAWDWKDGIENYRTIYLLNIDWWSDQIAHQATLMLGEKEFTIQVRRGMIEVITILNDCAVMPLHQHTDVQKIKKQKGTVEVTLQSTEADEILLFQAQQDKPVRVKVQAAGIHKAIGKFQ